MNSIFIMQRSDIRRGYQVERRERMITPSLLIDMETIKVLLIAS